ELVLHQGVGDFCDLHGAGSLVAACAAPTREITGSSWSRAMLGSLQGQAWLGSLQGQAWLGSLQSRAWLGSLQSRAWLGSTRSGSGGLLLAGAFEQGALDQLQQQLQFVGAHGEVRGE